VQFDKTTKLTAMDTARGIADWICQLQTPWNEAAHAPGSIPFSINNLGHRYPAAQWNYAFASMGLAAASKAFDDDRYRSSSIRLIEWMKTFQILDPFTHEHHGAIREYSPACPWCYTRDGISGGWGLVEMFRLTGDRDYLERAKLFGKWLTRKGLDDEGYPWFGVQLGEPFSPDNIGHIQNDIQGNFQGGSLNFFYQMYKATGDKSWTGPMRNIADIFVDHIQQDSGFFVSIIRDTKQPVAADNEYTRLHRGNDDLGTLGLLCMYRLTKAEKYIHAVSRFLEAAWGLQRDDGHFEESQAATPVILNVTFEARDVLKVKGLTDEKASRALEALYTMRLDGSRNPLMKGAIREMLNDPRQATMRANCYALIVLLKLFAGVDEYLCS
jgi:uncharacterized protein YyaL (SSP411 family)